MLGHIVQACKGEVKKSEIKPAHPQYGPRLVGTRPRQQKKKLPIRRAKPNTMRNKLCEPEKQHQTNPPIPNEQLETHLME